MHTTIHQIESRFIYIHLLFLKHYKMKTDNSLPYINKFKVNSEGSRSYTFNQKRMQKQEKSHSNYASMLEK